MGSPSIAWCPYTLEHVSLGRLPAMHSIGGENNLLDNAPLLGTHAFEPAKALQVSLTLNKTGGRSALVDRLLRDCTSCTGPFSIEHPTSIVYGGFSLALHSTAWWQCTTLFLLCLALAFQDDSLDSEMLRRRPSRTFTPSFCGHPITNNMPRLCVGRSQQTICVEDRDPQ